MNLGLCTLGPTVPEEMQTMASPQLQTAITMLKDLLQKPATTPQEMRANFEELGKNTPIPADIKAR
jgi:hypothetical protein